MANDKDIIIIYDCMILYGHVAKKGRLFRTVPKVTLLNVVALIVRARTHYIKKSPYVPPLSTNIRSLVT
jgi:hypothetical protein